MFIQRGIKLLEESRTARRIPPGHYYTYKYNVYTEALFVSHENIRSKIH